MKKINLLEKPDRLICLGILAYEPFLREYKKGKLFDVKKTASEYRHIFFWCVKEIFMVSKKIQKKLGNDFIFSWVDGFYFRGEKNIAIIENFLRSKKLNFKTYRLFKFNSEKEERFVKFNFVKRDKDKKTKREAMRKISIVVPKNNHTRDLSEFFEINEAIDKGDYSMLEK